MSRATKCKVASLIFDNIFSQTADDDVTNFKFSTSDKVEREVLPLGRIEADVI